MKNIHLTDRLARLLLGVLLCLFGFFWIAAPWSWLAYAGGVVMFGTALFGYCPVYQLLGIKPATTIKPLGAWVSGLTAVVLVALVGAGSYGSAFFTRKFLLEDFNAMNHFYKQTLFLTGKAQRPEAIANLDKLKPAFAAFTAKYTAYRPYDLKGDAELTGDFSAVGKILADVEPLVRNGDLHQAHLDLEKIRPIFQNMFKRNGFSMLSIALVDFHDVMELMLTAANEKDAIKIKALYPEISDKLKIVEVEANDDEIKAIRTALDDVLAAAAALQLENLPAKGETLKTSFVKVYLKRG